MKSRTFYSKFIKTSFVKQLWVMGLMAFSYFMVLPVPLAIMVNNWADGSYKYEFLVQQFSNFILQADAAYVLTVGAAVVVAFIQFSYLHSRREMDFYGSLSVRRESLFSQRLAYGFVDFAIPYTVMLFVCVIVGATRGVVTGSLIIYLMESWLYNLIGFLLIYFVTALAILLTGRRWVAFLGAIVLLSGGFLLQTLIDGANSVFFDTYYYVEEGQLLSYLSPVYLLYQMREVIFDLEYAKELLSGSAILMAAITILICVLLTLLLRFVVRIRPAEKAGQSMAFEIPARVIHIGLSIFGGFAIGMFAMSFVYVNDTIWLFAGAVFGSVCMYILVQFIYTLDIRRTFTYKWQIFAISAVVLALCSIYSFDLFGYDDYLPKQGRLESVAIRYNDDNSYNNFYLDGKFYGGTDYALETMTLAADDTVYGLLAETVAKQDMFVNGGYLDGDYSLDRLYVKYRLNSGREVERMYLIPMIEYKNEFAYFYSQEDYRNIMVPSLLLEDAHYTHLTVYYAGEEHLLYDDTDAAVDVNAFMEVYNRDIKALDSRVFVEEIPVAKLHASVYMEDNIARLELRVYEDCEETLALLEKMGFDPISAVDPENIVKIEIDDYSAQYKDEVTTVNVQEGAIIQETAAERMQMYTVTDKEQIAEVLSGMIDENYYSVWFDREEYYHIRVYMGNNDNGYEICFYGDFVTGQLPAELLADLEPAVIY